jgi:hypothetical protein
MNAASLYLHIFTSGAALGQLNGGEPEEKRRRTGGDPGGRRSKESDRRSLLYETEVF